MRPSIEPRRSCLLVNMPQVKALILRNRVDRTDFVPDFRFQIFLLARELDTLPTSPTEREISHAKTILRCAKSFVVQSMNYNKLLEKSSNLLEDLDSHGEFPADMILLRHRFCVAYSEISPTL